jgi:hypothetical protein
MPLKSPKIRRIGQFILVSTGIKALLFAAAYFLASNASQAANVALL